MPLRDQPYLPLYVQDFLTDEKLIECSAQATGVYIRLMCIMHKSEPYGTILLKQKDKQNDKQTKNFACKLAKYLPYGLNIIESSLDELIAEGVIILEEDKIFQKRMIKDSYISDERARAGSKGGQFAQAKYQAKAQANTENEIENETVIESDNKGGMGEKKGRIKLPTTEKGFDFIQSIIEMFQEEYLLSRNLIYEVVNDGKERSSAGKLLAIYKNRWPTLKSDEVLDGLRQYFKLCLNIGDDWLYKNMSLSIILSKFNEINNHLTNGNHKNRTAKVSDDELNAIAKALFNNKN